MKSHITFFLAIAIASITLITSIHKLTNHQEITKVFIEAQKNPLQTQEIIDKEMQKKIPEGSNKKEQIEILRKEGFKIYFYKEASGESVIASKEIAKSGIFHKEARIVLEIKDGKIKESKGKIFLHGL